ncbi:MAG: TRAP transporter permease [Halanaerobiales bacterium]|nr:TRAP transporter permease [Halanaerobiales bacterium]
MTDTNKITQELERYRDVKGFWARIVLIIAISLSLFHLYTSGFGILLAIKQRAFHIMLILPLAFLLFPFSSKKKGEKPTVLDIILTILGVAACLYVITNLEALALRAGAATTLDLIMGGILILLVLEGTRRSIGIALPIIAVIFLIYGFFGPYMPGPLAHRGFSITRIISQLYLTTEGIFGIPIGVSATFVFMFVLLGAFLERTGVSNYLLNLAFGCLGHFRGGPAKAAVVGSGLMGMISGSSIANTVTTGAITIPIMKKTGFKPDVAAGIEVAASTNGQFLPPIMGAAAFIMVEFTGIPYIDIIKAAFIPGILSYIAIFSIVHIEALKTGLKGMNKEELPPFWSTLVKGFYYIIPILMLLYFLIIKRATPLGSAFYAIVATISISIVVKIFSLFNKKDPTTPQKVAKKFSQETISALEWGAKNMVGIALACACAGIIIGVVNLTGLGLRMTSLIVTLANGNLLLTLIFAMIASIILGFGLPTTATYIVMATLTAPAVARLGVPLIAAHLFVFYYGIVADDTPPVSLAAYAAAGVAKSDPVKTGIMGFKFDLAAFLLPFFFVYSPTLLLIDTTLGQVIIAFITSVIGMYALAAAIQNYFLVKTNIIERLALLTIAILLIIPNVTLSLIGILCFALIYYMQRKKRAHI